MKKRSSTAGFTLVEAVVSIAILGIIAGPLGSSLVLAHRLNGNSQAMIEGRMAVSSAVEQLMSVGISEDKVFEIKDELDTTSDRLYRDYPEEGGEDTKIPLIITKINRVKIEELGGSTEGPSISTDESSESDGTLQIETPDVTIKITDVLTEIEAGKYERAPYYYVTVTSNAREDVSVEMQIHSIDPSEHPEGAET